MRKFLREKKKIISIKKKAIRAPKVLKEPINYSKPVSFSRGVCADLEKFHLLLISGTASVNQNGNTVHRGNFLAQTKKTFENIAALLKSEGASWRDVVKTTCYLKDMQDYESFNKIRNKFYKQQKLQPFPASTCVEANLCRPDLFVEIEAFAIFKKLKKR